MSLDYVHTVSFPCVFNCIVFVLRCLKKPLFVLPANKNVRFPDAAHASFYKELGGLHSK